MIYFLRSQHAGENLPVMYMFANPELRKRFHTPVAGYVPAPSGTVLYTKILNWEKVRVSAAAFNERVKLGEFGDRLRGVNLTVSFKVQGAPPLCLHVDAKGVEADVSNVPVDITVSSDVATLSLVKGEGGGAWALVRALLSRRVKFSGSVLKMLALYRNMWVFRQVFSDKIT